MRRMLKLWGLLGLCMGLMTACAGDTTSEQTLAAAQATRGTQAAFLRDTATLEADRRALTLEYLATAGTRAAVRQREIVGTLNALGLDTSNMDRITPQATATRAISEQERSSFDLSGGITRIAPSPDASALALTALAAAQPTMTTAPTVDPDGPNLTNITLSTSVGPDDCATGGTSEFVSSEDEIYIVMTANRLTAGNTVVSRWFKDGAEVSVYDFVRDFDVDGACIWFFVDQTDFTFTAGAQYAVSLELNGAPISDPIPFAIVEG